MKVQQKSYTSKKQHTNNEDLRNTGLEKNSDIKLTKNYIFLQKLVRGQVEEQEEQEEYYIGNILLIDLILFNI